jgi:hypothetical protein
MRTADTRIFFDDFFLNRFFAEMSHLLNEIDCGVFPQTLFSNVSEEDNTKVVSSELQRQCCKV